MLQRPREAAWPPPGPNLPHSPASKSRQAANRSRDGPQYSTSGWTPRVLLLAAAVDILGGAILVVAPTALFAWAGLDAPTPPQIVQCLGLVLAGYGLGYVLAARQPRRLSPLVGVGLVVKVLVPVGFAWAAVQGDLPWKLGLPILAFGPVLRRDPPRVEARSSDREDAPDVATRDGALPLPG